MQTERRKFSSSFKAKVAIEALREQQTLSELSVKYELHPNQITDWKKQLLSGSEQIFSSGKPLQDKAKQKNEKDELHKKIGQLTIEVDWLKKKSEHLNFKKWTNKNDNKNIIKHQYYQAMWVIIDTSQQLVLRAVFRDRRKFIIDEPNR